MTPAIPKVLLDTALFSARMLALAVATSATAFAYVDPGTGAMIIQMIGAAVAGALFYFRSARDWLASRFGRRRPADGSDEAPKP
jgi:hypothetical protein